MNESAPQCGCSIDLGAKTERSLGQTSWPNSLSEAAKARRKLADWLAGRAQRAAGPKLHLPPGLPSCWPSDAAKSNLSLFKLGCARPLDGRRRKQSGPLWRRRPPGTAAAGELGVLVVGRRRRHCSALARAGARTDGQPGGGHNS